MGLNVIYVEDDAADADSLATAVAALNSARGSNTIRLQHVSSPEALVDMLRQPLDVVIADVVFESPDTQTTADRLKDIVSSIRGWEQRSGRAAKVAIIAYTDRSKGSLESCLTEQDDLYDLLDKNSASFDYLAWRLGRIDQELGRLRPSKELIHLIESNNSPISWHKSVVKMALDYSEGWNERDQITRAFDSISDIATQLDVTEPCTEMWTTMVEWEYLERAIAPAARGHARHVINVFWLGYLLITHEHLRVSFKEAWKQVVANRPHMGAVQKMEPLEAVAASWYLTALFHDVGNCVQHATELNAFMKKLVERVGSPWAGKWDVASPSRLTSTITGAMDSLPKTLRDRLVSRFKESVADKKPDSGVVAANQLVSAISEGTMGCLAAEAARSAAVHNAFLDIVPDGDPKISWRDEPLMCLLVLCDQLQAWDREGLDSSVYDEDRPDRAELVGLSVQRTKGKVIVQISINYFCGSHVRGVSVLKRRLRKWLKEKIRQYPEKALRQLSDWPFTLNVTFALDGDLLETRTFN